MKVGLRVKKPVVSSQWSVVSSNRTTDNGLRTTDPASRFTFHISRFTRHASPVTRHSERGVALVITLILLSVITFMAITFLVVSRSEHGSVTTQTDMTMARLAAETGRDRAIAELLTPMLTYTNPFNYGLMVELGRTGTMGMKLDEIGRAHV